MCERPAHTVIRNTHVDVGGDEDTPIWMPFHALYSTAVCSGLGVHKPLMHSMPHAYMPCIRGVVTMCCLDVVGAYRWREQPQQGACGGATDRGWELQWLHLQSVDLPWMQHAGDAAPRRAAFAAAGRWARLAEPGHAVRVPVCAGGGWRYSGWCVCTRALLHPKCCVCGASGTSTTL